MVLQPIGEPPAGSGPGEVQPAWQAIEKTQKRVAQSYWLITQPDHAALSGALAAAFVSPQFPAIDGKTARAIEVHDSGWGLYPSEAGMPAPPALAENGKPVSFLEVGPAVFLPAWEGSIARAAEICAVGGYIVSRHFQSLGRWRLQADIDAGQHRARLEQFAEREAQRQQQWREQSGKSAEELESLLAVLQFCDLLSLYLCCGTRAPVEFPQKFANAAARIQPRDGVFALTPSPFQRAGESERAVSVGVQARRFPGSAATTLAFMLV